ncbi:iron-containing alcohol dehydrogenase [Spirochaeta dissipatitropha]
MSTSTVSFSFNMNPVVYSGPGTIAKLLTVISSIFPGSVPCRRILIVRGGDSLRKSRHWRKVIDILTDAHIEIVEQEITCEPSVELIDGAVEDYRDTGIDLVLAIGGGSVLDAGKALAAMLCSEGSVIDYLEGVGSKKPSGQRLPLIAVPTTAGTGSEATMNAVISQVGHNGFKKSLRHQRYIPDVAILDAELSLSCPLPITAACGLDAFTQLFEAYTSIKASAINDALARSGLEHAAASLPICAGGEPDNIEARQSMLYASYLSGVCLANSGLGVVHGLAGVIGGFCDIPHGLVCGRLLYPCLEKNIQLMQKNPDNYEIALKKYAEVGCILEKAAEGTVYACCREHSREGDNNIQQNLDFLLEYIQHWKNDFALPRLSEYGLVSSDYQRIADAASVKNNPVNLEYDDFIEILINQDT